MQDMRIGSTARVSSGKTLRLRAQRKIHQVTIGEGESLLKYGLCGCILHPCSEASLYSVEIIQGTSIFKERPGAPQIVVLAVPNSWRRCPGSGVKMKSLGYLFILVGLGTVLVVEFDGLSPSSPSRIPVADFHFAFNPRTRRKGFLHEPCKCSINSGAGASLQVYRSRLAR